MNRKIIFVVGVLIFIALGQSCEKENKDLVDEGFRVVENQNGLKMLEFKDEAAFENALQLRDLDEYLRILPDQYGFTSYYSRYLEFLDAVNDELLTEENEYLKILEEYSDVVVIEEDMILPRIIHPQYLYFVNPEGMVKIGNQIISVTDSEVITSMNGNESILRKALLSNEPHEDISRESYMLNYSQWGNETPVICGSSQQARYTRIDGSRAVNIYCYVRNGYDYYSAINRSDYWTRVSFVGLPFRKNVWNNWVGYKADNYMSFSYSTFTNNQISYQLIGGTHNNTNRDRIQYDNIVASGSHIGEGQYNGNYEGQFQWLQIVYRSSGIPVSEKGVIVECGPVPFPFL